MSYVCHYVVIRDNEVIFTGKSAEVKERYNLTEREFRFLTHHHTYFGDKLKIYTRDRWKILTEENKGLYEYTMFHLNKYGNTVIRRHPERVTERLEKEGIHVRVSHQGVKPQTYYLIERIKNES